MDINAAFPSKFLKSSDLLGRRARAVMERVEIESIGEDRRPVVYFRGKEKGLVLNKTNANTISDMFGSNTDGWTGKEIILFPTRVDFKGERVDAIRVEYVLPPTRPAQLKPQPMTSENVVYDERNPPPHTTDDMNDLVPF